MQSVIVLSDLRDWPLRLEGVEVIGAKEYLTDARWVKGRSLNVFNLCRSYRYQRSGYYVSLLAAARRHRPFPSLMTVLDMKSRAIVRTTDGELEQLIQRSLSSLKGDRFELSIYFGKNLAKRHERLALRLFNAFPAPLLRAQFSRSSRWQLVGLSPIAANDVPESHHAFLQGAARSYFARPRSRSRQRRRPRFHLAILQDPDEVLAPSDPKALRRFVTAAEGVGFGVDLIGKNDYSRIPEFDALLIRETTYVNHHTFRFAQRAQSEGLVVIDDPQSILRCTNKVYLSEALELRGVPMPRTLVLDAPDAERVAEDIGYPCVLKHPDSAFSRGVVKCEDENEFRQRAAEILKGSDLFLVQEFFSSEFDWRIGVLDGQALYACRYHMVRGHWQVVRVTGGGRPRYGKVEPVPLEAVPRSVLRVALRAARAIGDGLYGVDLKQAGGRIAVMEVNDNPNIDAGYEDAVLRGELYRRIMEVFMRRVEASKEEVSRA